MLDKDLTDTDIAFIDDMLEKYAVEDSIGNFSELDGFLTALVSGPEMIMPSQWMPWVWGDAEDQPTWETEKEASQFFGLLMRAMNRSATTLMDDPSNYQPMFENFTKGEEEHWFMATWCLGYLRAVFISDWPEVPEEYSQWLALIEQQSFEDQAEALMGAGLDAQVEMATELTLATVMLHRYWLEQRMPVAAPQLSPSQPLRAGPKIGRNDPCPCGSGKKFKQCCLH